MKSPAPSTLRWRTAVAVAFAALVPVLVFWRGLRGVFFQADLVVYYLPAYTYATRVLRTGVIPLWAPEMEGGQPFHAQWEPTLLYPVDVPFRLLLPPWWALNCSLMFHYGLAAVGMFAYGRRLSLSRPAALVSAAVYAVNGFMIAHLEHPNLIVGAAWLPWLLLAVEHGLGDRPLIGSLGMGFVLGMTLLGGHPDIFLMGALLVGLLILLHPVGGLLRKRSPREALAPMLMLFGGYGLGVTLAAAQIVPTLELARLSWQHHGASVGYQNTWSLRPPQLLVQLLPDLFGRNGQDTYWGIAHYWEECSYVGALALVLALAGLISRHRMARFYGGLAVLSVWLAMGTNGLAFSLLRQLPALGTMRLPCRCMFLFDLSVAVLAGTGAHWLAHLKRPAERMRVRRLSGLTAVLLSLTCLWLLSWRLGQTHRLAEVAGRLRPVHLFHTRNVGPLIERYRTQLGLDAALLLGGLAMALLLLLIATRGHALQRAIPRLAFAGAVATLFLFGSGYHTTIPARWVAEPPFTVAAIGATSPAGPFRVLQWDSLKLHSEVAVHRGWWPKDERGYRQYVAALPGNYNLVWGLSGVRQEEWSALPLQYTRRLVSPVLANGERDFRSLEPYLRWWNTAYIISRRPLHDPALSLITADRIHLYRTRDAGRRVWIVHEASVEPDESRMIQQLSSQPAGLMEKVALLGAKVSVTGQPLSRAAGELSGTHGSAALARPFAAKRESEAARARHSRQVYSLGQTARVASSSTVGPEAAWIVWRSPTRATVLAETARQGYLVFGETWAPGWRAAIDGHAAPVLRANVIHRAVALPAGRHQVEFRYAPASFRLGLYGSASALAVLLALLTARLARSA